MKGYETEAHERWGDTSEYREHEQKTKHYTKEKWAEVNEGLMALFAEFCKFKNKGFATNSLVVQTLVVKLRDYITQSYYTCTNEILSGLGEMYVADERFKKNIDQYGEGTAEFVSDAIAVYTK